MCRVLLGKGGAGRLTRFLTTFLFFAVGEFAVVGFVYSTLYISSVPRHSQN